MAWSVIPSVALIMDGYDGVPPPSLYAEPGFLVHFGKLFTDAFIPAEWQTSLASSSFRGTSWHCFSSDGPRSD